MSSETRVVNHHARSPFCSIFHRDRYKRFTSPADTLALHVSLAFQPANRPRNPMQIRDLLDTRVPFLPVIQFYSKYLIDSYQLWLIKCFVLLLFSFAPIERPPTRRSSLRSPERGRPIHKSLNPWSPCWWPSTGLK